MTELLQGHENRLYEILLMESQDFGVGELKAIRSKQESLREALDISSLQGILKGVPAIIVGAAPSLKIDGKDLDPTMKDRALILSGGSALEWMGKKGLSPHFSLLFDPECNPDRFRQVQEKGNRSLFTLRANSKVVSSWKGKKWLLPTEAFHLWESAWHPTETSFNVGWNVATALAAFARYLGCSSLLFLGVDFGAGKSGEIYPDGVLTTQRDKERESRELEWELGRAWLSSFTQECQQERISIFFGENSPLDFAKKISSRDFFATHAKEIHAIEKSIQTYEEGSIKQIIPFDGFEAEMKLSYFDTQKIVETYFHGEEVDRLYLEPFYQKILFPLWKIWSPRFQEACLKKGIRWMEKEQEIAFILSVLREYQDLF